MNGTSRWRRLTHWLHERGIRLAIAEADLPLREATRHLGLESMIIERTDVPRLSDAVTALAQPEAPKG
jgi:hypothetical protein